MASAGTEQPRPRDARELVTATNLTGNRGGVDTPDENNHGLLWLPPPFLPPSYPRPPAPTKNSPRKDSHSASTGNNQHATQTIANHEIHKSRDQTRSAQHTRLEVRPRRVFKQKEYDPRPHCFTYKPHLLGAKATYSFYSRDSILTTSAATQHGLCSRNHGGQGRLPNHAQSTSSPVKMEQKTCNF